MNTDMVGFMSDTDAFWFLTHMTSNLIKASVSDKTLTLLLRRLVKAARSHYPKSTLFVPSRIKAHAVNQWFVRTTRRERVCEAVLTMWKGGVIDTSRVPDLYQRASTKEFVCIKPHHDDDSLYVLTFLVDERYRRMIVRVVPMSNVIKMVILHNTSALDASIPNGMSIEEWATKCLNSDGIVHWPPYTISKSAGFRECTDQRNREIGRNKRHLAPRLSGMFCTKLMLDYSHDFTCNSWSSMIFICTALTE